MVDMRSDSAQRWRALICLCVVIAGCIAFAMRGYHDEKQVLHFRDFKEPYASARCMLLNCDPYDEIGIYREWTAAGGINVEKIATPPFGAVYPPFSITLLTPLALLRVPVAYEIWKAIITATFAAAVVLVARTCLKFGASLTLSVLLAAFAASSTILIMLGQVSGVAIPLLVIWFACLLEKRWQALGTLCLFLATMLKPQECVFLAVYLLFGERAWKLTFLRFAIAGAAWTAMSILWISLNPNATQWWPELLRNLGSGHHPGQPVSPARGTVSGFEQIQLGDLFAAVQDSPMMYNSAALAVCALLFALWIVPAIRLPNTVGKHTLCAAALSCLTLLAVYHRQYDTRILLLAFPAVGYLLSSREHRRYGMLGVGMLALTVVVTSHIFLNALHLRFPGELESAGPVKTVLLFRPLPIIVTALLVYFLVALYRELALRRVHFERGYLADPTAESREACVQG